MNDIHEGGCACGAVRYRVTGLPEKAAVCHCRYCQLRTGSAFGVSVYFPQDHVELLSGTLQSYSFRTAADRSFTQKFCPVCGTSVLWEIEAFPGLTGVAGGTFDPPTFWYDLKREVYTRSRAPFVGLHGISDSSETSRGHNPVIIEKAALMGGEGPSG